MYTRALLCLLQLIYQNKIYVSSNLRVTHESMGLLTVMTYSLHLEHAQRYQSLPFINKLLCKTTSYSGYTILF